MCIAIANKKGNPISKKQFQNCWENNPDGAGVLYREKGVLKTMFELNDWEVLYKVYVQKIKKSNMLLHFRVTSKGATTIEMCHPFMVSDKLGFIHNGTIFTGLGDYPKDKSDTWAFNEKVLKFLPKDFYKYPVLMELLSKSTGNSKMAFMDSNGYLAIFGDNKSGAHFDKKTGNWFSNDSYKSVNDYMWKGTEKVWKKNSCALVPKSRYASPSSSAGYDTFDFSWSQDLREKKLTNGFEKTMLEIASNAEKFSFYKDGNVMLEQFIQFRSGFNTIRRAMEKTFQDFLYDTSDREMINCIRYYIAQYRRTSGKREKESWVHTKQGWVKK